MRIKYWENSLADAVEAARNRAFAWGEHDCCLFAANCALAITGTDFAAHFRGRYDSAAGAYRALLEFAGGGIEETVTKLLGDPISPRYARRGDVVMTDVALPDGSIAPALGVCIGAEVMFAGPNGLVEYALRSCTLAWRVG